MRILITGICGFVGCSLARRIRELIADIEIVGLDNLIRPGTEINRRLLPQIGCRVIHGDTRNPSDFETLPAVDWVIDAAANPSVLAGVDGKSSSRQVIEHNLIGTLNLLEYCRKFSTGFILLSTSRVYSINALASLPLEPGKTRFELVESLVTGVTHQGISESFSQMHRFPYTVLLSSVLKYWR